MGKGLYNAAYEHDACGVGMVVNIHGNKSHDLVDNALKVLENYATVVPRAPTARRAMVLASCCKYHTSSSCFKAFRCPRRESMAPA